MDSTRVRRRSTATQTRSRSKLPRLNTREPVQVERRESSSIETVILRIFQILLFLILASTALVSFAILADRTWLPRLCDQPAVKEASSTLSQVIQIDMCRTSLAEHEPQPPSPTCPALAIIKRGQSIGNSLEDFVESYVDISYEYREVDHRIQRSALLRSTRTDGHARLYQDMQSDVSKALVAFNRFFQEDLRRAVTATKHEYREAAWLIAELIHGAQRNGARCCFFFEHWAYNLPLVGDWFSTSFSAANLFAQMEMVNSHSVPQFGRICREGGLLMKRLGRLIDSLEIVKESARGDEALFADIERHILDLSRLSVMLDALREQSRELGGEFVALLKMIKRHRCLGLSQEDGELATEELAELQAGINDVESRWRQGSGSVHGKVTTVMNV
jgi:hypothetical protein